MTMITTMPKMAARPPKPERGSGRYTPLPDPPKKVDMAQHKHVTRAQYMLEDRYEDDPTTLVIGEVYLRQYPGERSCFTVPDCMIAFGVEADRIEKSNGYVVSEVGKPPDFVLEVASESTGVRDHTVKRRIYQNMGAPELWRFDPSGGRYHDAPLAGDILVDGEYHPIAIRAEPDGTFWGYSPALGLYLVWQEGNLRFYDPAINQFLVGLTESKRERDEERAARIRADRRAARADQEAAAERDRAEAERAARVEADRRAEAERQRAEEERQHAEEERQHAEEERAARAESDQRAAEAEAEVARLRRLLGDLG